VYLPCKVIRLIGSIRNTRYVLYIFSVGVWKILNEYKDDNCRYLNNLIQFRDQVKDDEMGRACSTNVGKEE
jgi:hypothetical protein